MEGDTANKLFSVNLKSWNGQAGSACQTSNTKGCILKPLFVTVIAEKLQSAYLLCDEK
jgi:hypothetical protein